MLKRVCRKTKIQTNISFTITPILTRPDNTRHKDKVKIRHRQRQAGRPGGSAASVVWDLSKFRPTLSLRPTLFRPIFLDKTRQEIGQNNKTRHVTRDNTDEHTR